MKFFLRADGDDQFDGSNLSQLDFIDVYSSEYSGGRAAVEADVVNELSDRNGGFAFSEDGTPCKFVAPTPRK